MKNYNILTAGEETWLTPKHIVEALAAEYGLFDLDPACPPEMPWRTAKKMLTKKDDGLTAPWKGSVFMNPPYGRETQKWMRKMAEHKDGGIALIFARTSCKWFHETVFNVATACFFFDHRLRFCDVGGMAAPASAPAPSVLVAYGEEAYKRLESACRQKLINGSLFKFENVNLG